MSLRFTPLDVDIYLSHTSQIANLIIKKALIKVLDKYTNFADIFFLDLAFELSKYNKINNYAIEPVNGQQPPYEPIYSLKPVEMETLKAYIKTNLANGFMKPFKSPIGATIFFDCKSNGFFRLYINYKGLNNLTIKNLYSLPLVGKLLD